jgi:tRNA(Leu) C34 or U34 (ribose-2'-O)-methylase TrmL
MPAVVLINPKYLHNVAAAIRACSCFGVDTLFWTGTRVNPSAYERLPREERMKGYKEVQWKNTERPFDHLEEMSPVCVELLPSSSNLSTFTHPERAVYVFGPEDGGVPKAVRKLCHNFIFIPAYHCLNLAAAMNVVLYDRFVKLSQPVWKPSDVLKETRGEIAVPGWDGK